MDNDELNYLLSILSREGKSEAATEWDIAMHLMMLEATDRELVDIAVIAITHIGYRMTGSGDPNPAIKPTEELVAHGTVEAAKIIYQNAEAALNGTT